MVKLTQETMRKQQYHLLSIPLILIFLISCAKNPVTGKREFMLLSKDRERAMGVQSDESVVNTFGLYNDQQLQQYIDARGEEMAKISHRPELDYEFKLLDSPVINAFAVPGGFVYFTRGIMAYFNSEAEFAGVLGHEIGHVAARHSAKQYSKQTLAQVGLVAGALVSDEFRQYAGLAQSGLSVLFLKFSRDHERESDKLGVEYSSKVGYDSYEMADFFSTLDRQSAQSEASSLPTFLSTHPDPQNRQERVKELTQKWQKKLADDNFEVGRESYLRMIDGLVYGEDPRQGYFENGVFYHPEMKFRFNVPSGWQTQNSPQQVQMAPSDGNALMVFTLAQGNNPKSAAEGFLSRNELDLVSSENTTINGFPALRVMAQQQQQGGLVQLMAYFIQDGNTIFNFMGISSGENFNAYSNTFASSIGSYSRLTDQSKIDKKPERIKIVEVARSGPLQDVLLSHGVLDKRLEELALLNGMQLSTNVEAGMLIKVIE